MDIFVVYCIKSITSISEFKTKWCPWGASQRSHSANLGRILFLSMSHQKSIFMLIKKQVPRVQRNLSFNFCCVCLSTHWAEEHSAMCPSPCDKGAPPDHRCSLPAAPDETLRLLLTFGQGNPYFKPPNLKLFQRLQDSFTHQNALNPPYLRIPH